MAHLPLVGQVARVSQLSAFWLKLAELVARPVREWVRRNLVLGMHATGSIHRYRPELHYMRGPGPKWFEGMAANLTDEHHCFRLGLPIQPSLDRTQLEPRRRCAAVYLGDDVF